MAFVSEIRSRVRPLPTFAESPEGFVAEFRPRNQATVASPKSFHDDQCQPMDYTDRDVYDALSEKKFSKENMTQLLEKSILTLVEKLLIARSVESIVGRITVKLSDDATPIVVQLSKQSARAVTNNYDYLTELPGLNIKFRGHHHQAPAPEMDAYPCLRQVEAASPCNSYRDEGFSMCSPASTLLLSPSQPSPSLYSPSHPSQSLPPSPQLSPAPSTPPGQLDQLCSESQRRRDSDEESGYTSTGKDDSDSSTRDAGPHDDTEDDPPVRKSKSVYNDYFCKGFDGSDTFVKPGFLTIGDIAAESFEKYGGKMDDEDNKYEGEARLVIDENPQLKSDTCVPMEIESSTCKELKDTGKKDDCFKTHPTLEPAAVDIAEEPSISSSDATDIDTDAPVDLSGDSELSRGVLSVVPHPQSLVSKHPEGLKCKQCLSMMPSDDGDAVARHALEQHNLYACNFCYRSFTAKNNLKRHVRLHTGSRPYRCTQCSQTFARRDDLKGHQLRHNYTKQFRCSICSKGYTDRSCVKNHMAKEHRSRTMHVCPQCGESFDRDDMFSAHKRSHPELQNFSCDKCSFIGTNNLMTLKHGLLHNYKLFSCKPCNAHFADAFDYTNHVRVHKNNPSFNKYICCFCDMALSTYEQYVRHEYSHAQGKTHQCKICRKQFKSKSLLSSHLLSHSDDHFEKVCKQEAASSMSEQAAVPRNVYSREVPRPSIVVEPESEEEYGGELLDLSMKKPSSPDFHRGGTQITNLSSSQRLTGRLGAPRNGCVAESVSHRLEQRAVEMPHAQSMDDTKLETKAGRPVFNAHQDNIPIVALDMLYKSHASIRSMDTLNIHSKTYENISPVFPNRPKSAERNRHAAVLVSNLGEYKSFKRSNSNGYGSKSFARFSPYHRQKMVDLAAKYYAARGPKIVLAHSNKAVHPVEQSTLPVMVGIEEFQHSGSQKMIDEMKAREDLNSETTLRHHVPTFVKSETLSENEAEEDHSRPRGDAVRNPEHFGTQSQKNCRDVPSPSCCEICKESFGSFAELEAHSLDVHKRYLCEHCMKLFTTRPNRDRHARVHTGERPYKCDLCDLAFFRGDDLKYHRTTRHPSALPYVCTRCSTSFTWGRDLERHIRHAKCKVGM